jgi:hypothetical protein
MQHQRYHLLSAATLNNSRNRNFVHRKDLGRIEAGIPGSPHPHRRRRTSRADFGERWPSRLVATAAEDRLTQSAHAICGLKSQATKKEEPP